jgi:uncharacterized protein YciU (UPF0263 family)
LSEKVRAMCQQYGKTFDDWRKHVTFVQRAKDFHDVIQPDAINIIDFIEVHSDYSEVSGMIQQIHLRTVNSKGMTIISMQKRPGSVAAKGGWGTLEKPLLYLTLSHRPNKKTKQNEYVAYIAKAKTRHDPKVNPNYLCMSYRFEGSHGVNLIETAEDWFPNEGHYDFFTGV